MTNSMEAGECRTDAGSAERESRLGRRLRILHLDKKMPYPPRDGGSIATLNVARAFARLGHDVTVLAMNTNKHYFDPAQVPPDVSRDLTLHAVSVNTDVRAWDALSALVRNRSYNVERFISPAFDDRLSEMLTRDEPFDVIQLEGLYLVPYVPTIRRLSNALVSLRAHNVEHTIWERRAQHEPSLLKRAYLRHLATQLKAYELKAFDAVDVVVPISPIDEQAIAHFGCTRQMHMCPASFSEDTVTPGDCSPPHRSICFLGALDWGPNVEGLHWFMTKVWPAVVRRFPDLVIHIAGRNMPAEIEAYRSPNVQVDGEVDDAYEYMRRFNILIVPLLSGSGMRVKIVEGLALGKVVISTPVGIEGIDIRHGEHAFVAERADEYAAEVIACLDDASRCRCVAAAGLKFAREHFGSVPTTRRLVEFYERELAHHGFMKSK